ncbi:hypothetical protein JHK87_054611 [Glycine soja]|nr:hypothetical protein JHK87_054611 [Glycine soja]
MKKGVCVTLPNPTIAIINLGTSYVVTPPTAFRVSTHSLLIYSLAPLSLSSWQQQWRARKRQQIAFSSCSSPSPSLSLSPPHYNSKPKPCPSTPSPTHPQSHGPNPNPNPTQKKKLSHFTSTT